MSCASQLAVCERQHGEKMGLKTVFTEPTHSYSNCIPSGGRDWAMQLQHPRLKLCNSSDKCCRVRAFCDNSLFFTLPLIKLYQRRKSIFATMPTAQVSRSIERVGINFFIHFANAPSTNSMFSMAKITARTNRPTKRQKKSDDYEDVQTIARPTLYLMICGMDFTCLLLSGTKGNETSAGSFAGLRRFFRH